MDSVVSSVLSIVIIVSGVVAGLYLYKTYRLAGMAIGIALSSGGVIVLGETYFPQPRWAILVGSVAVSIVLMASMYLAFGRNPRIWVLFSFMPLGLIGTVSLVIPWTWVVAYAAMSFAAVASYDLSGMKIGACMRNIERYSRLLVEPLYFVEKVVTKITGGPPPRLVLSAGYFTLQVTFIVVLPYLIDLLTGGALRFLYLLLALLVFFGISTGVCIDAEQSADKDSSDKKQLSP